MPAVEPEMYTLRATNRGRLSVIGVPPRLVVGYFESNFNELVRIRGRDRNIARESPSVNVNEPTPVFPDVPFSV